MKRTRQKSQAETKAVRSRKAIKQRARLDKSTQQARRAGVLEKTLALIRARPGIRPSERPSGESRRA
jgi:hypothetical protein